jgi:hypothetical protein
MMNDKALYALAVLYVAFRHGLVGSQQMPAYSGAGDVLSEHFGQDITLMTDSEVMARFESPVPTAAADTEDKPARRKR